MKTSEQSGFAVIEAVLVLVVVGILGFTGWFVWNAKQNTDKALSNTANSQPAILKKQTSKAAERTKIEYLAIIDWGVKIPLSADNEGASYKIGDPDPSYIFLTADPLKGTPCAETGVGYYVRFTKDQFDGEAKMALLDEYPEAIKVGSYYYGFGVNPAYQQCSSDATTQKTAEIMRNAFKQSLKNAQTIN